MWKAGFHSFSFLHTPFHQSPQTSKAGSQGQQTHFFKKTSFWVITGITRNYGKQVSIAKRSIFIFLFFKKMIILFILTPSGAPEGFKIITYFKILEWTRPSCIVKTDESFLRCWNYFSTLPGPQLLHTHVHTSFLRNSKENKCTLAVNWIGSFHNIPWVKDCAMGAPVD